MNDYWNNPPDEDDGYPEVLTVADLLEGADTPEVTRELVLAIVERLAEKAYMPCPHCEEAAVEQMRAMDAEMEKYWAELAAQGGQ